MNIINKLFFWISSIILTSRLAIATEFTFDLADNAEECFYESIQSNVPCTFEFQASVLIKKSVNYHSEISVFFTGQVVSGGQLDVDVIVQGPNKNVLYKELRKEYDMYAFNTTVSIPLISVYFILLMISARTMV